MPKVPQIPGIKAEPGLAINMRNEVAQLLKRNNPNFPGAQPVSFAKKHIQELHQEDYYVCEKSDGIRCLMYCTEGEPGQEVHYLIDRKNDYYWIQGLHFPKTADDFASFHTNTIIDGELVIDTKPDGREILKYLVFDCLLLDGQSLVQRPLDKRLGYFRTNFFRPYEALCKAFPDEMQYFPFYLQFKNMEFSYAIDRMFNQILPNLQHGNDGLIFTAVNAEYKFGTDDKILKWKPADENSIDFRMTLEFPLLDEGEDGEEEQYDWYATPKIHLAVNHGNNRYEPYAYMHIENDEWEKLKAMNVELDERIVECALDEQQRWRFKRFRDDKKDGNHISVVKSVMESIRDGVSQTDLEAAAPSMRSKWKSRAAQKAGQGR